MNRFFTSPRFVVAATFATAALVFANVAQARPEIFVSIGLPIGPAWVEPAPVYAPPPPVFVQPRRVYVQPVPVYARPPVVFEGPRWGGYEARHGWERERAWRHAEWRRHEWQGRFGDRDRDGHRDHRH